MVWRDEKEKERYLKQRQNPDFVVKKKKYLNEWYKKNRKKQAAYMKKRRLENREHYLKIKRATYYRRKVRNQALGLRMDGKPLLNPEQWRQAHIQAGKKAASMKTKKERQDAANKGHAGLKAKEKIRLDAARKKLNALAPGFLKKIAH